MFRREIPQVNIRSHVFCPLVGLLSLLHFPNIPKYFAKYSCGKLCMGRKIKEIKRIYYDRNKWYKSNEYRINVKI